METTIRIHATSVELLGKGVLVLGPSGAGKSSLARDLLCLGGTLIADDQTILVGHAGSVILTRPENLPKGIEVRGIGILAADMLGQCPLSLVIDLSEKETNRLPQGRSCSYFDQKFPLWRGAGMDGLAQSIYLWAKFGMLDV